MTDILKLQRETAIFTPLTKHTLHHFVHCEM